jgi:fucose permease
MKTVPIFLAFLCMGFGDAVGPFVGLAKVHFSLSNFMATLIPFVGFLMFGLLSVPMGLFQDRKGKKFTLLLGLAIALVGLVIPFFAGLHSYALFLLTILLLGAGATILQVAGNPIMRDVSAEGKYSRNLSLGQFVKAIGSMCGPVIPPIAARWFGADWSVVFPIFSVSLLITMVAVSMLHVDEKKDAGGTASFVSCLSLLKNPYVLMMVMGIFLYVGAEVCVSAAVPLYLESEFGISVSKVGVLGTGLFFLALTIGRFSGGVILTWMKPAKFFIITSVVSVLSVAALFLGIKSLAVVCFFLIGLGFANIFPLIFSITVDHMPERTNELSGLMITAIVGGAIMPPIMGLIADRTSVLFGFIVPLLAIIYILIVSLKNAKQPHQQA